MKTIEISGIQILRKNVLDHPISIQLEAGDGLGIFGPNGSGKTTFLDIVAGILPSKEATVITEKRIGYAMQKDGFYENLSCLDNLLLEANYAQLPKSQAKSTVEDCVRSCGADTFLKQKVSKLSAGMRARLALAASLICQPEILLMDESFNALDENAVAEIKQMLLEKKKSGLTIIFVSHNREEFSGLCERVLYFPTLKEEVL